MAEQKAVIVMGRPADGERAEPIAAEVAGRAAPDGDMAGGHAERMAACETPARRKGAELAQARGHLSAAAVSSLRAEPHAAHAIGARFKQGVAELYGGKNTASAEYEAARAWVALTWAFPADVAVDNAATLLREHQEAGAPVRELVLSLREQNESQPLRTPEKPSALPAYTALLDSMLVVLKAGFDPFWRECDQPDGAYAAFRTEFAAARQLPGEVYTRWYRQFAGAMSRGQGTADLPRGAPKEFTEGIQDTSRDGVAEIMVDNAVATARIMMLYDYASPDTPRAQKADEFRSLIPQLAKFAEMPKAEQQVRQGHFNLLLKQSESDPAALATGARKALGLGPGEPVTAVNLDPAAAGRCPGPALHGVEKYLGLGAELAADTLWSTDTENAAEPFGGGSA